MKRPQTKPARPSKDDVIAFIGQHPGNIGTREIARAFGMKNADRADLKRMLRELADEGRIERRRKKLHHPGTLPHVVLSDITARDADGELIALPTEWDEAEHGPAPKIRVRIPRHAARNEVAGVGDRALLRVEETGDKGDPIRHSGRVIKLIDRAKQRVLGIFRAAPGGGGRLVPIDKKQLGQELAIPPGAEADARDGDLVAVEAAARRSGYGLASARVRVLQHLTEPLLHGFRAIPVIALVPLSVLLFGIGETAKVALVATGAFFPIWIATFIGVRDVHIVYLRSAACLGAGRLATMVWVILPAALPFILTGLRQAMAISLIVLVAAELSGATAGVAYMMSMGHQLFRVDVMFIGLLLLGTLGFVFDRLFVLLTQRLFPWYTTAN